MESTEHPKSQSIQVIARAASILRLLGQETNGMSLGQIATQVQLPRSTVQRIVAALAEEGFVESGQGDGGITLGPQLRSLARASEMGTGEKLQPHLKRLSEVTGETVDLAVLEGCRMRFIDQIEGIHRLRTVSRVGESFPLSNTASGKAALACLSVKRAADLVYKELQMTGHVETSSRAEPVSERLSRQLAEIRNGALATDENEHTDGICALGFAFEDEKGGIFALSIPVPSSRYGRVKAVLSVAMKQCRADLTTSFGLSEPAVTAV